MALNDSPSKLDASQIIQRLFDGNEDRLRVQAEIESVIPGGVEVAIASTDDNIAIRNTNNNNELLINSDGSINVVIENTPGPSTSILINSIFTEVKSVGSSSLTTIGSYSAPVGSVINLQKVLVSGQNIAEYQLILNSAVIDKQRTYFGGQLNALFDFSNRETSGLLLNPGDNLVIKVIHTRPFVGDFNSRIQVSEAS